MQTTATASFENDGRYQDFKRALDGFGPRVHLIQGSSPFAPLKYGEKKRRGKC